MDLGISPEYYRYYDLIYKDRTVDLEMWLQFASEAQGPILDVGCGTGRVLNVLAEAGYRVVGIDISQEAIQQAMSKVQSTHVTILQVDMRDFDLPTKDFDLALLVHSTFEHCLTVDAQIGCLHSISKHLRDNGLLVIDVSSPISTLKKIGDIGCLHLGHEFVNKHDCIVQWLLSYNVNYINQILSCVQSIDTIDQSGVVHREVIRFPLRFVFPNEMELLLKVTGFELEAVYGDYRFQPLLENNRKAIFVARKSSSAMP